MVLEDQTGDGASQPKESIVVGDRLKENNTVYCSPKRSPRYDRYIPKRTYNLTDVRSIPLFVTVASGRERHQSRRTIQDNPSILQDCQSLKETRRRRKASKRRDGGLVASASLAESCPMSPAKSSEPLILSGQNSTGTMEASPGDSVSLRSLSHPTSPRRQSEAKIVGRKKWKARKSWRSASEEEVVGDSLDFLTSSSSSDLRDDARTRTIEHGFHSSDSSLVINHRRDSLLLFQLSDQLLALEQARKVSNASVAAEQKVPSESHGKLDLPMLKYTRLAAANGDGENKKREPMTNTRLGEP